MIFASRAAAADHINQIKQKIHHLKRALLARQAEFSAFEAALWRQALQLEQTRRYQAAVVVLQRIDPTIE